MCTDLLFSSEVKEFGPVFQLAFSFFDALNRPWKRESGYEYQGRISYTSTITLRGEFGFITWPCRAAAVRVEYSSLNHINCDVLKEGDIIYDCLYATVCSEDAPSKSNTIHTESFWSCA